MNTVDPVHRSGKVSCFALFTDRSDDGPEVVMSSTSADAAVAYYDGLRNGRAEWYLEEGAAWFEEPPGTLVRVVDDEHADVVVRTAADFEAEVFGEVVGRYAWVRA